MLKQGLNSNGEPIRSAYVEHDSVPMVQLDDGMARQEFAEECDINVLMARYERTGVLNHYSTREPQYLDVTEVPDLQSALQYMQDAQAAFMRLPAVVRKEFDNDPVRFVEYAGDPSNLSQLRQWGLAAPETAADAISAVTPGGGGEPPPNAAS